MTTELTQAEQVAALTERVQALEAWRAQVAAEREAEAAWRAGVEAQLRAGGEVVDEYRSLLGHFRGSWEWVAEQLRRGSA